jgi:putative ABC transport system permease protein
LGVSTPLGRTLVFDDAKPGATPAAVLDHEVWVTRFGADSSVLGRNIVLDGEPSTIVGVMPERFAVPGNPAQIWTPLDLSSKLADRGRRELRVLGRLHAGVTVEHARVAMETTAARLAQRYPDTNRDWSVNLVSVPEMVVGKSFRESLVLLQGAVVLVLLIACANAANLLLARAATRRKEIAIRTSLGAAHWRIIGQLLTESALLAAVAGAAGLGLAAVGVAVLKAFGSANVPRLSEVHIDGSVLAFTAVIALLSGVLFGLAPAWQLARARPQESLNAVPRGSGPGATGGKLRAILVVAEVMLSLVLLIGAGLLLRSFARLQQVELGFDSKQLLVAPLPLPTARYDTPDKARAFYDAALERVRGMPGVIAAAAVNSAPFAGVNSGLVFTPAGSPPPERGPGPDADYRVISPGYLETMKIPLVRGRRLSRQDMPGSPPAVLINQTMARRFWPGRDPIGQRLDVGGVTDTPVTIVGVVGDARYQSLETPEPRPMIYLAMGQTQEETGFDLVLRSNAAPTELSAVLRDVLRALDPSLPVPLTIGMDEILSDAFASRRFALALFGVFAGVAVLLAAVGVYGVMSYVVRQRTQELGIRVALGASRSALVGMVLVETMRLVLVGVLAGLAGAWLLTRLLSGLLFGIAPTDPPTFWGLAGLLVCLAVVAGLVPAYRAARVDPMAALRAE